MINEETLRRAIGEATIDFSNSHKCKVTKEFAFKAGANHLVPALIVLAEALRFECGERCAHQNPCNANEALNHAAKLLQIDGSEG